MVGYCWVEVGWKQGISGLWWGYGRMSACMGRSKWECRQVVGG